MGYHHTLSKESSRRYDLMCLEIIRSSHKVLPFLLQNNNEVVSKWMTEITTKIQESFDFIFGNKQKASCEEVKYMKEIFINEMRNATFSPLIPVAMDVAAKHIQRLTRGFLVRKKLNNPTKTTQQSKPIPSARLQGHLIDERIDGNEEAIDRNKKSIQKDSENSFSP